MKEFGSRSIAEHFQTLQDQRTLFFQDREMVFDAIWKRHLPEKWSVGETLYHLILMLRVFRRFSKVYIPVMKPVAAFRKHRSFPLFTHDIYKQYHKKHKQGMSAPPFIKPTKKIQGVYTLQELQQILEEETDRLIKLTANVKEVVAGNIYYIDPIAGHPNLIQSIHLLAIHEQHHFDLLKQYQRKGKQ